jgi:hypothetical protein
LNYCGRWRIERGVDTPEFNVPDPRELPDVLWVVFGHLHEQRLKYVDATDIWHLAIELRRALVSDGGPNLAESYMIAVVDSEEDYEIRMRLEPVTEPNKLSKAPCPYRRCDPFQGPMSPLWTTPWAA